MPAPQTDVCLALRRMQDTESTSGVGPDQHQGIAVLRNAGECLLHIGRGMHGLAVYFRDHFTLLQAGVICRTTGSDLLDHGTVHVLAGLQLLPDVRRQVLEAMPQRGLPRPASALWLCLIAVVLIHCVLFVSFAIRCRSISPTFPTLFENRPCGSFDR
jgi:hypothetical protein